MIRTDPQTNWVSDHYGLPSDEVIAIGLGYVYNPANADNVIRIPASLVQSPTQYKNKNGANIVGDVYGIKKSFGVWRHYKNMGSSPKVGD